MSVKGFVCPNCSSQFCSGIRFWRDGKQAESWDLYKCHDCGRITQPGTMHEKPADWQPERTLVKRKVASGQVDIFGKIENVRDLVSPVPKFVEAPDGSTITVSLIPVGATQEYRDEVSKMVQELNRTKTGRDQPFWYKYRNIKRGKK